MARRREGLLAGKDFLLKKKLPFVDNMSAR
jgi:hypothetical protein